MRPGSRGFFEAFGTCKDWIVRFTPDSPRVELKELAAVMVLFIDITIALDRTD